MYLIIFVQIALQLIIKIKKNQIKKYLLFRAKK